MAVGKHYQPMHKPFIVYVLKSLQNISEHECYNCFWQSFHKMVTQQVSARTITHEREHDIQLTLVQKGSHVRYEVRVHKLPSVVDLVLYELTVSFRHAVQVEILHRHQVAALVVFAQEHDRTVRETRAQHRAHGVLLQVRFEVHVTTRVSDTHENDDLSVAGIVMCA